ncbi:MAG: hypothetical protein RLZZ501_1781, partial [Pseudomonadota bacterium]
MTAVFLGRAAGLSCLLLLPLLALLLLLLLHLHRPLLGLVLLLALEFRRPLELFAGSRRRLLGLRCRR